MSKNTQDRIYGCMFGSAVGDALGAPVEFKPRGSFPRVTEMIVNMNFGLAPGGWTDDTSMALCLGVSLRDNGFDPKDQLERYVKWFRHGYMSVKKDCCVDIGRTCAGALISFERTGETLSQFSNESSCGNGSLMRIAPVPLYCFNKDMSPADVVNCCGESSKTTHTHPRCVDACKVYGLMIWSALRTGCTKTEILSVPTTFAAELGTLHPDIVAICAGSYKHKTADEIESSGFIVHSIDAALWAFYMTSTFEEGAIAVVNLGDDADTIGAIYGALAGAHYGFTNIPRRWLDTLQKCDMIRDVVDGFCRAGESPF